MAEQWTMKPDGIRIRDPGDVSRLLVRSYLVIESKANKDELVEFCHLVILLDLRNKRISPELDNLVTNVMNDPQGGQVQEAVRGLKSYAKGLEPDPREGSIEVARAWRKTKELRDGRVAYALDDGPKSQGSSFDGEFKTRIPIHVKVWSQTQDKSDLSYSEIRCAVPDLAMISNIHNIIRYAAISFNFPYVDGQRQPRPGKKLDITTQAILYEVSSDSEWNMIDKSTKLAAVRDTTSLHLVNTTRKTAAVAVVVRPQQAPSEPFIFDIKNPSILVEAFKSIMESQEINESIRRAENTFEMGSPSVMPNRSLQANPAEVPSGTSSPPSNISPSPTAANTELPSPPAVASEPQRPSAPPHHTQIVGAQSSEAIEHSPNDTPSSSPTESHYSDAREAIEPPPASQVHRDPPGRLPEHPPQVTPTNPLPLVPTPGASSTVVVESSVTHIPTISNPENPPVADSSKPE